MSPPHPDCMLRTTKISSAGTRTRRLRGWLSRAASTRPKAAIAASMSHTLPAGPRPPGASGANNTSANREAVVTVRADVTGASPATSEAGENAHDAFGGSSSHASRSTAPGEAAPGSRVIV